jgi:hypothetical protein
MESVNQSICACVSLFFLQRPNEDKASHPVVPEKVNEWLLDDSSSAARSVIEKYLAVGLVSKQDADVEHIEMPLRRDEKDQIAVADSVLHIDESPLGEAADDDSASAGSSNQVERSGPSDGMFSCGEVLDQPEAGVIPNPIAHVVISRSPLDDAVFVPDAAEKRKELFDCASLRQGQNRLGVGHAVKSGERHRQDFRRDGIADKRIADIGTSAQTICDQPHSRSEGGCVLNSFEYSGNELKIASSQD